MNKNLTVRPRNGGWQYIISYKKGDKWRQTSKQGYGSKAEAKRAGQLRMAELEDFTPADGHYTFKDCARLLLEDGQKSVNTKKTYAFLSGVFSEIEDMSVADIGYKHIAPILNEYARSHRHSSSAAAAAHGKRIMAYAQRKLKVIKDNPFDEFVLKSPKLTDKREKHALTLTEVQDLISKLSGRYQLITAVMGLCGLRIGEARGLTRDAFDLKTNQIHVRQQMLKTGQIAPLKTRRSYRTVPMPPTVRDLYLKAPAPLSGPLFGLVESVPLRQAYTKAGYAITPHELRHSYTTNCISAGIDYKTTAQLIGDTVEMVFRVYSHVNTDMMDAAKAVLQNF